MIKVAHRVIMAEVWFLLRDGFGKVKHSIRRSFWWKWHGCGLQSADHWVQKPWKPETSQIHTSAHSAAVMSQTNHWRKKTRWAVSDRGFGHGQQAAASSAREIICKDSTAEVLAFSVAVERPHCVSHENTKRACYLQQPHWPKPKVTGLWQFHSHRLHQSGAVKLVYVFFAPHRQIQIDENYPTQKMNSQKQKNPGWREMTSRIFFQFFAVSGLVLFMYNALVFCRGCRPLSRFMWFSNSSNVRCRYKGLGLVEVEQDAVTHTCS